MKKLVLSMLIAALVAPVFAQGGPSGDNKGGNPPATTPAPKKSTKGGRHITPDEAKHRKHRQAPKKGAPATPPAGNAGGNK